MLKHAWWSQSLVWCLHGVTGRLGSAGRGRQLGLSLSPIVPEPPPLRVAFSVGVWLPMWQLRVPLGVKVGTFWPFVKLLKAQNWSRVTSYIFCWWKQETCAAWPWGEKNLARWMMGTVVHWTTHVTYFHKCLYRKYHCCHRRNDFLRYHFLKSLLTSYSGRHLKFFKVTPSSRACSFTLN